MKIMYILPSLKRDGPNNQMYYLIGGMKSQGNDVVIVSLGDNNNEDTRFHEIGVCVVYCSLGLRDVITNDTEKLYRIIESHNPDIIQTYGIRPDTAVKKKRIKGVLVTSIRCSIKQCYYADYGRIVGYFATKYHRNRINDGRAIVACSDAVASYNTKELNIETDAVIRNVVEAKYRRISDIEREKQRDKLGFLSSDVVIVTSGYLTEAKDPLVIVNAIRQLNSNSDGSTIKLVLLGEGPLREQIERYEDPNIYLAGHVSNVSEWLDIADVYASASHFEGMPNAVLEGMRSSLPLILSDIPSHIEIIDTSSEYVGEVFKTSDPISFVDAFRRLMTHDLKTCGANARKLIANEYSMQRLVHQYMSLYSMLIKDS